MATTSIGAPGVVFPDGTTQASASPGSVVTTIYSSPSPWTKPSTLKAVRVTMLAGGGSGGGSNPGPLTNPTGGAGGNGGYLQAYIQAPAIPAPLTVTVGAAGATPGSGAAGNPGGTSSFGALYSTTGGAGGSPAPGATPGTSGAAGGAFSITATSTSSALQLINAFSNETQNFGVRGTSGGGTSNLPGNTGTGYGVGGGGGGGPNTTTGGAGRPGFMIVEEFY